MALVRKKDEKGLDMTSVSLIARFSRQYLCIYLHSVEGTKGMEWTSQGNKSVCVCVCLVLCFCCSFIIALFTIPSVVPGRVPSPPLAATSMTGTEGEKALCMKQICHSAN